MINPNFLEEGASLQSFFNNIKSSLFFLSNKLSINTKYFNLFGLGNLLADASFLHVKKAVICIDDLERKGNDISVKEILGLVNQLKEDRQCKIILISNEDQFNEADHLDFKKFMEKIIDIRFRFCLNSKETAEIALPGTGEFNKQLRILTARLNINNIRTIKKIERLANAIKLIVLKKSNDKILIGILHSLVLFAACYYENDPIYPNINYLRNFEISDFYFKGYKKITNQQLGWIDLLKKYRYFATDELDIVIADAVELGYINEEKLTYAIKNIDEKKFPLKLEEMVLSACNLYLNSFEDDSETINCLKKIFNKSYNNKFLYAGETKYL